MPHAPMPSQDDLDHIMEVMDAAFEPAFGEAWTRRQVSDALVMGNCHYALAEDAGKPCGFTLSRHTLDEEELLLIAVHPHARRRGIARHLLDNLFTAAKHRGALRLFLEMRENNPALHLYETASFLPVGRRPGYYKDGKGGCIDAITFLRDLNTP